MNTKSDPLLDRSLWTLSSSSSFRSTWYFHPRPVTCRQQRSNLFSLPHSLAFLSWTRDPSWELSRLWRYAPNCCLSLRGRVKYFAFHLCTQGNVTISLNSSPAISDPWAVRAINVSLKNKNKKDFTGDNLFQGRDYLFRNNLTQED